MLVAGGPKSAKAPEVVYRVATASRGMSFAYIDPVDASMPTTGNRFDVPGGGVLYCSTDVEGCFRETLARLRPSPRAATLDEDSDNHFMRAGCVPASWRDARRVFAISLEGAAPFLDVEAPESLSYLDTVLATELDDHLDVSDVRGRDRLLTRAIALWAYAELDEDGDGRYSGIRYISRHGNYECWAVFDGTPVSEAELPAAIERNNPDLAKVAGDFGLTIH